MNIEAKHITFASPASPSGLEVSGSNSEISKLVETAKNAENVVLWQTVWERVKYFADQKGLTGSQIRNTTLELVGGLALIASAAACGDEKATASTVEAKTQTPTATASATPEMITPTATVTVKPTEAPKAVTVEPQKTIPVDAQQVFDDFATISSFKPEENEAISKDFTKLWLDAKNDFYKYGAYSRVYSILWTKFKQTNDPALLTEMKKVEGIMSTNWPDMHKQDADHGGFYRP